MMLMERFGNLKRRLRDINENHRPKSISNIDSSRRVACEKSEVSFSTSNMKKIEGDRHDVKACYSRNNKKLTRNRNYLWVPAALARSSNFLNGERHLHQEKKAIYSPISATETSSFTHDEASSISYVSASATDDVPWKKEKVFLQGAPKESDWWMEAKGETPKSDDSCGSCDDRCNQLPEFNKLALSVTATTGDDACSSPILESTNNKINTNHMLPQSFLTPSNSHDNIRPEKEFHNCGYTGWLRVREAWRQPVIVNVDSMAASRNGEMINEGGPRRGVPPTVKRELVKCLQERRHFELSRSIPLKDMIEAYCEAWESESEEKQV